MTKADIISKISDQTGIEKVDVQQVVETFFNVVKEAVKNDDNVYVRGFGSFITKKRAAKKARNISQNTTIIIEEHFIPSFKPSK